MEEKEESQCNDNQENSVKQFKRSSIHANQNTLQDDPDRISLLPDSLLLHILSLLRIEEVIKTSLLSRRWRYLWVAVPCLDFRYMKTERKLETTTFIDRFLFHHDDSKVRELYIAIYCIEKLALLVDSWIQFAVRHEVEVLDLDLVYGDLPQEISPDYTLYKLPSSLFRCGSLTSLVLRGCDLNLPATIQLNSIKTLCLEHIDLDSSAIEHITSNCPLLEDLTLRRCNELMDLNICITNGNVKKLKIYEFGHHQFDNGITTINSPNLLSLKFFHQLPRTKYQIKKLSSLVIADFCSVGGAISSYKDVLYGSEETGCDFVQLLDDLRHVKELRLNSWCIQSLTAKEIRGLKRVSINATCVKLSLGFAKWELPGIAYLLQSASYIETLQIECCCYPESELREEFVKEYDFKVEDFWKLLELGSSSILQNTKIIRIIDFHTAYLDKDAKNWEAESELVRFLLKTSKVLERMTIETCFSSRKHVDFCLGLLKSLEVSLERLQMLIFIT